MRGVNGAALAALLLSCALCAGPQPTLGHETSMAVLSLKEQRPGQFVVRWLLSPGPAEEAPQPVFPGHCRLTPPSARLWRERTGRSGEL